MSNNFDTNIDLRSRTLSEIRQHTGGLTKARELSVGYLHSIRKFVDECAETRSTDDTKKWSREFSFVQNASNILDGLIERKWLCGVSHDQRTTVEQYIQAAREM